MAFGIQLAGHRILALLALIGTLSLSACNEVEFQARQIEPDWIHDPTPASPTPTPTPTPTLTPTPTPTPSPTPNPTSTPSPTPTPTPSPTPTGSDLYTGPAEMERFVTKFIDDGRFQGVDVLPDLANPKLEIRIASLDGYGSSVIGLCETGGNRRRVTFDPDFWNSVSETQKELVSHHELGHCVLYRAHRSETLASGAYASIMYPIILSSSTYLSNYSYYQQELFAYAGMAPAALARVSTATHICDRNDLLSH